MELYPIHAGGIKAYCSDLVIDPLDGKTVLFLSIAGYQATVKGIIGNLLSNHAICIELKESVYWLGRTSLGYKIMARKMSSGLSNAAAFPKLALPGRQEDDQKRFFIFTDSPADVLDLFFRHLDEKTDLPIHPSWSSWLWDMFLNKEGWLVELHTMIGRYIGYSVQFDPNQLHEAISGAIRLGVPEITACMSLKQRNDSWKK